MSIEEKVLLRAYLQTADRAPHTPTHDRIIQAARKHHLAGGTVLRGILGSGYHGLIKSSAWSFVEHVPIILEIVDSSEKLGAFIKGPLNDIMHDGMVTLERAAVIMHRRQPADRGDPLQLAAPLKPLSTLPQIEPSDHMQTNDNGVLLRVFIGESDRFEHKPLYQKIVEQARALGLAGATVLRGTEGFGANSVLHTSDLLVMSSDLPIVIEIVDSEEKINLLLPHLETMVRDGLITMEHVMILMYRHNPDAKRA